MNLNLHVKSKFNLGFHIWIVNFEKSVYKLLQINVAITVKVQYSEKSLTNDTWELRVLKGI